MANVIKHKRNSGSDPSASNLVVGELAIRTDNGKLFTKMDSGAIAEIAGGGSDIAINTLSSSSATGGGSATFNGSAYRFTLSSPPSVSAAQLLVSVNGVIQKPVTGTGQPSEGFSVSGNDIIFGDAPATGADFFILTFRSLGVSEPADNSVTSAKIVDGTIVGTDLATNIDLVDNQKIRFGTGNDLEIFHDGSINYIDSKGTQLRIETNVLRLRSDSGETFLAADANGAVELYHDNVKRFETDSTGVRVVAPEGEQAILRLIGDEGDDNNDYFRLNAGAGTLKIQDASNGSSWEDNIVINAAGSVELYYNNSKKFETLSDGVKFNGILHWDINNSGRAIELLDNQKIFLGDGTDLQIFHDGNQSIIRDTGTGSLMLQGSQVIMESADGGEVLAKFIDDGAVELYHNNSKKFETTSDGGKITGELDVFKSGVGDVFHVQGNGTGAVVAKIENAYNSDNDRFAILELKSGKGSIRFNSNSDSNEGAITYEMATNAMIFGTNNATERMRIDSSGNVGIDTTSPQQDIHIGASGGDVAKAIRIDGTNNTSGGEVHRFVIENYGPSALVRFKVSAANATEENILTMHSINKNIFIHSQNSSGSNGRIYTNRANANVTTLEVNQNAGSGTEMITFRNSGSQLGTIHQSGSGVSYQSQSDYRLKENDVVISDGITRLKQLRPIRFNWKVDTETVVDGFFAHEVSAVVPEAVRGNKDEVFDTDGVGTQKKGDPKYQQLDQSKLIPLLTAALQEAIGRIEALEAK